MIARSRGRLVLSLGGAPGAENLSQGDTGLKTKSITCHVLSAPVERPFTSSRGWFYNTRGTCLVEIDRAIIDKVRVG